ncbi:MAG: hypothetical protein U0414_24570 [Polyangiaceae bacterium]
MRLGSGLSAVILIGCSASPHGPTAHEGVTSATAPSASGAPQALPTVTRAEVDALLAEGASAWAAGDDASSSRALRDAGRGLAALGVERHVATAMPTELPVAVAEDELIVPVCFELVAPDCALLSVRVSRTPDGAPRRARIDRVLHRSEQPLSLRSTGGLPFVAFNDQVSWLHPTVDRAIDLGPGVREALVGDLGRAALTTDGSLRLIDTAEGRDRLQRAIPSSGYGMAWAKNGAWLTSCENLPGPAYVVDAASGAVLFQEDRANACALDVEAGIVAYVGANDANPTLRTRAIGETTDRGSTPILGVPPEGELELQLDANRHVVGVSHETYGGYSTTSYGNYDIRTLRGAAPRPPAKAPADPFDGLALGSAYQGVPFPDVAPFANLATPGHALVTSGMIGPHAREGYHWTGGRSLDGRSAALFEDLEGREGHDRALLIVDRKSRSVRARVPVSPRWLTNGEWEIVMFLDDHLIVVRSGSDQWFVDADTGSILFAIPIGSGLSFIVPTLLSNGLLAQTDDPGLSLFDMSTTARPSDGAPWTVPSQLAPSAVSSIDGEWTEIHDGDRKLFVRTNGELELVDGDRRRPALDSEVPPWLLCKVGDTFYPFAVCRGAREP